MSLQKHRRPTSLGGGVERRVEGVEKCSGSYQPLLGKLDLKMIRERHLPVYDNRDSPHATLANRHHGPHCFTASSWATFAESFRSELHAREDPDTPNLGTDDKATRKMTSLRFPTPSPSAKLRRNCGPLKSNLFGWPNSLFKPALGRQENPLDFFL